MSIGQQPTITSFSPSIGPAGTTVTINGTNFSAIAAGNVVTFSGLQATVLTANATVLTVSVPTFAATGPVAVSVGGLSATGGNFNVTPAPMVTGFSPFGGSAGDTVTITGNNFSMTAVNNTVQFNGVSANVTGATTTTLTVTVPANASTGLITVTVAGQTGISANPYYVVTSSGFPSTQACTGSAPPIDPGSTPGHPGLWLNPNRSGTSWSFHFIYGAFAAVWFTYDANGRPVWLSNLGNNLQPAQSPNEYYTPLYKSVVNTSTGVESYTPVGQLYVSFVPGSSTNAAIRWQWNDAGSTMHDECVYDYFHSTSQTRAAMLAPNANTPVDESYTGAWHPSSGTSGWGIITSVGICPSSAVYCSPNTTVEADVPTFYDTAGNPVWVTGVFVSPLMGATSTSVDYTKSTYPGGFPTTDCTSNVNCIKHYNISGSTSCTGNCNQFYNDTGTLTRTYTDNSDESVTFNASVGSSITGGDAVSWPMGPWSTTTPMNKLTDFPLVSVNQTYCATTCTVQISWMTTLATGQLYKRDLTTNTLTEMSANSTGSIPDTLSSGSDVQYELRDGSATGTLLYKSSEVKVGTLANTAPAIYSFTPTSGAVGTIVTISGTNFDPTPANNTVKFNNVSGAVVQAATTTTLTVIVPTGATTGLITVTVGGVTATSSTPFTVTNGPSISSFTPTSGPAGTTVVTITGANFDPTPANNIVKFNNSSAATVQQPSSTTTLTVVVPNDATTGPITVTVAGLTGSSASPFTVGANLLSISSFAPPSGPVGTQVTINGQNFSPTTTGNVVTFTGTSTPAVIVGTPTSTQIVAAVPAGAQTGSFTVNVGSATATSPSSFTVTATAVGTPTSAPPSVASIPGTDPTSDAVGATAAQFRVDEGGNATYSIPIQVAPGTAGLTPKLALSYNSRLPGGVMGPGWAIEGSSAITRCRQTRESGDFMNGTTPIDGNPSAVNFTTSDRFCLDGVRLLVTSGTYGASGSTYSPENDPTTQVTATASNAAIGPDSFKVQRKDGSTSTYGNTAASTSALVTGTPSGSSTSVNVSWNLARVQDSTGNYIDYLYTSQPAKTNFSTLPFANAAVESVLAQVNYTGHLTGQTSDVTPYASVSFNYTALPAANLRIGYQGGITFLQSQQLSNVTVSDTSNGVLRYYVLAYQTSASGSGFQQLSQITECRDSTQAVCYPPTVFSWSQANNAFVPQPSAQSGPDFSKMVGFKVADIDGDGRQDIVWASNDGTCASSGGGSRLYVGFLSGASNGRMTLDVHQDQCAPIDLNNNDRAWYLVDYDGDGRADLLIGGAGGTNWKLYLSRGNRSGAAFDTVDQLASLTTPIAIPAGMNAAAILADVNGDGLPDLIVPTASGSIPVTSGVTGQADSGLAVRLMTRSGSTLTFADPVEIVLTFASGDTTCAGTSATCAINFFNTNPRHGSATISDVDGDGRADLTLIVASTPCSPCTAAATASSALKRLTFNPSLGMPSTTGTKQAAMATPSTTNTYWYQFTANGISTPTGFSSPVQLMNQYIRLDTVGDTTLPKTTDKFYSVDLNGDGLADILYQDLTDSTGKTYKVLLNNGNGYNSVPISTSAITNSAALQLIDIDGDGKTDLVFFDDNHNYSYVSLTATTAGWAFTAAKPVPAKGGGQMSFPANNSGGSIIWTGILGDFDGDGIPDLFAYETYQGAVASYFTARVDSGSRYQPRDVITGFTNGYGANTTIGYQPLANVGVYQRSGASGYPALTTASYGWGSPVFDVIAPMYVVSMAKSSAPTQDASAISSVYYRYAGATMQAGGRGFLGFREIWSFDGNDLTATGGPFVATVNRYAQRYPFIGMPVETIKEVLTSTGPDITRGSVQLDACAKATDLDSAGYNCFSGITGSTTLSFQTPWPDLTTSGIWISRSVQQPMCTGAGCNTAPVANQCTLNASLPAIASGDPTSGAFTPAATAGPVFGYVASTADTQYDLSSGSAGSPVAIAATRNFFCYDGSNGASPTLSRGDLLGSLTVSQDGSSTTVAQKATSNTYADNASLWYFGRLSQSTVTFARPSQSNISRSTSYTYDSTTGLLTYERIQSGGTADQDLRTLYDLDAFGNRTAAYQCSANLTDTQCRTHSGVNQQQASTTVLRYAKTTYSTSNGRYVAGSSLPFYTSASGNWNEQQATRIDARDEFGNPVQQHSINDTGGNTLNGVATTQFAKFGVMGRPYFAGDSSGHATTTTFRMCGSGATCSSDSRFKFRSQTLTTGAPSSWTYYDVLGRPAMQIAQSFDANGAGKLYTGACSYFDAHNRALSKTEPFFVNVTAAADGSPNLSGASPCTSASYATTSQYDVLGRVIKVTNPDGGTAQSQYVGLSTFTTNPRNKSFETQRNALGEVVESDDPGVVSPGAADAATTNLKVTQTFDAAGDVLTISRNAGNGAVVTTLTYDLLGRKLTHTDADSGQTSFTYNATGDVLSQTDAKNQVIMLAYDALGRKWQRITSNAGDGNNLIDTWSYDTGANGYGQLASESHSASAGTYTAMSRGFVYDNLGRLSQRTTTIAGSSYTETTAYDSVGRARQQQDASGQVTLLHYTTNGFVDAQTDTHTDGASSVLNSDANSASQQLLYELLGTNERGQPINERRGGSASLATTLSYYPDTGRLSQVCSGASCALQDLAYAYDPLGNLTTRVRNYSGSKNPAEMFTYDALNRLNQTQLGTLSGTASSGNLVNVLATQAQTYDALGNLCSQAMTGSLTNTSQTYSYAGPAGCTNHGSAGSSAAVTAISGTTSATYGYDADGNQITRSDGRNLTYNVLNQIASATLGSNVTKFEYGPDGERFLRNDNGVLTLYIGKVEIQKSSGTVTEMRRYLGVAIDLVIANSTRYMFSDHLGSVDTIAKKDGTRYEAGSFDAWGNRRNPDNWQNAGSTAPLDTTTHGFTGHEHVDAFGFIHMNGRIYDPLLGKMLQADPLTGPGSQGLNRYSYVANNPLSLTDPTGYSWWSNLLHVAFDVSAVIVGSMFGIPPKVSLAAAEFVWTFAVTGSLQSSAIAAFTAYFTADLTSKMPIPVSGTTSAILIAQTERAVALGVASGMLQSLQGGHFGSAFFSAAVSSFFMPSGNPAASDYIRGAIVGGTASRLAGGKFANGAATAIFQMVATDTGEKIARSLNSPPQGPQSIGSFSGSSGDQVASSARVRIPVVFVGLPDDQTEAGAWLHAHAQSWLAGAQNYYDSQGIYLDLEESPAGTRNALKVVVEGPDYRSDTHPVRWPFFWRIESIHMAISDGPQVFAHELGHAFGLTDRYVDTGPHTAQTDPGFVHNLMGDTGPNLYWRQLYFIQRNLQDGWKGGYRYEEPK